LSRGTEEAGNIRNVRRPRPEPAPPVLGPALRLDRGKRRTASNLREEPEEMAKREVKYMDPELRERLKEEIKASDKGAEPRQWSARKSQFLVKEYEKAGGYRGDKDEDQKRLEQWTEEEWQTQEGGAKTRDDGETKRYPPKEAWKKLSPKEREATKRAKREDSKRGEQYVDNTEAAREARKEASVGGQLIEGYDDTNVEEVKDQLNGLSEGNLKKVRAYEEDHKSRKTILENWNVRSETAPRNREVSGAAGVPLVREQPGAARMSRVNACNQDEGWTPDP
jgi:hypothetical protein